MRDAALIIGAHVSIRRGYLSAAQTAVHLGASAFQYFPSNPRSLSVVSKNERESIACAQYCKQNGLVSVGHAPYGLNLAVMPDTPEETIMLNALAAGLKITELCGSIGLVVHFGKFYGSDPLQGYRNIIQLINKALRFYRGPALILLENGAGQGSELGTTLEELAQIRSLCEDPQRVGFCLDTCHAFASGLWTGTNWKELEQRGRELHYWDNLRVIHLNDSAYASGSRRDRHANIGEGCIGKKPFLDLFHSKELQQVPFILETPADKVIGHQAEIIRILEWTETR
jgi:deoxyribonuclease IV